MYWIDRFFRKTKWIFIILIIFSAIYLCGTVVKGVRVYPESYTKDPYPPLLTYQGTLDMDTAHFLDQEDYFVTNFSEIFELIPEGQDLSQENDDTPLTKHVYFMKQRLKSMEEIDVADAFLNYKHGVNSYYKGIISVLDSMLKEESFDTEKLLLLYSGLVDFKGRKTEELPGLFDQMGVEYTIEVNEDGSKTVYYKYTYEFTDVLPR